MYKTIFYLHSGWRWLALLALLIALGYGLWGWLGNKSWSTLSKRIMLIATIVLDIQLILGLTLYVTGAYWSSPLAGPQIAHPLMMILALVVIHVMNVRVKRATPDMHQYRNLAVGTLATLALIVLGIVSLGSVERLFTTTSL